VPIDVELATPSKKKAYSADVVDAIRVLYVDQGMTLSLAGAMVRRSRAGRIEQLATQPLQPAECGRREHPCAGPMPGRRHR
jgi:hypothetical protein